MATKIVHPQSDFECILNLTDCQDNPIGWPSCDWTAKFYTVATSNSYDVSCIGGRSYRCFNDNGKIHVIFDNHGLFAGDLQVEFVMQIPNDKYPDGYQKVVIAQKLDIRLTTTAPLCGCSVQGSLSLPVMQVEGKIDLSNYYTKGEVDSIFKNSTNSGCECSEHIPYTEQEISEIVKSVFGDSSPII